MAQRLLFVGAGAIGSYLGAFITRAGHDVTLVDAWAGHPASRTRPPEA